MSNKSTLSNLRDSRVNELNIELLKIPFISIECKIFENSIQRDEEERRLIFQLSDYLIIAN